MNLVALFPGLPTDPVRYFIEQFLEALPLPVPDTPKRRTAGNQRAVEAVAALHPDSLDQLSLAIQAVLCDAHAGACLRHVTAPGVAASLKRSLFRQAMDFFGIEQLAIRDLHRCRTAAAKAARQQAVRAARAARASQSA